MNWPHDFESSLNDSDEKFFLADSARCAGVLQALASCEGADFSIEHNDGPILVALLNPERAFVMWMREESDQGQHAVDENADASDGQKFTLHNGQVDEFSLYDTVSRELALEAVAHFIQTRQPLPRLEWSVP